MSLTVAVPTRHRSWLWRRRLRAKPRLMSRLASPSDEMLRVLIDESACGVAVIDSKLQFVRGNEALRRMVSRACDLSAGSPVAGIFESERVRSALEELSSVCHGRVSLRSYVTVLRGKTGMDFQPVELSAVALREVDGTVSGALLQFNDISAQKTLEAQLTQSQKLQAVGQLAGGIAHDFNNLLTAMIGAADEALDRSQQDAETIEDLSQIRSSAERGAALVRQLLAFGRQQALQPRAVAINDAVEAISALLRRLLGSTVRLVLELEQPGWTVRVDPTQLDQVLVNLAVNARDAMGDGGQLTLRTGHITLFRALVRGEETIPPGEYVMIEVQDTGVGIPRDVLPHIFDPFFTTRRERGGTGLGLSTVHGIVRQSDGFLAVDSLVGKGTRIRVYLPRHDGDATATLPIKAAQPELDPACSLPAGTQTAPCTILLVDDEEGVRRLAVRAMTKRGWTVLSAESGELALALLHRNDAMASLSAIVSDVVMPGMDGATLIRAVRAVRPGLPAILASGYADELVRSNLEQEGIVFIPKPYTLKALIAAVEDRCRESNASQS